MKGVRIIKKGEARQSIEQTNKTCSNGVKTQSKAISTGMNWLKESQANISNAKLNDLRLRFAYFGK